MRTLGHSVIDAALVIRHSTFVIRHSLRDRHSTFVIRHSSLVARSLV